MDGQVIKREPSSEVMMPRVKRLTSTGLGFHLCQSVSICGQIFCLRFRPMAFGAIRSMFPFVFIGVHSWFLRA